MRDEKRVLTLNDFEHRLMVGSLNEYRNELIREGLPTDDLNSLIIRVIDAPTKARKAEHEAR